MVSNTFSTRLLLVVLFLVVASVPPAIAGPIVSQPFLDLTQTPNEIVSDAFDPAGAVTSLIAADNFVSPETTSATTPFDITWWGRFGPTFAGAPAVTPFTIEIFTGTSTLPGTGGKIFSKNFDVTRVSFLNSGVQGSSNDNIFRFDVSGETGIELTADTTYWISIFQRDTGSTVDDFIWVEGATGGTSLGDFASSKNLGVTSWDPEPATSSLAGTFNNLAIELTTPTTLVPEPSSLALLGMGVLGLFGYGYGWRQRKRDAVVES